MSASLDLSKCANCGARGDNLMRCVACKEVKYCSVACQRAHRPKHKKACRKRAAALHQEALFRQPPPNDECPVCALPLPINPPEVKYQACCGKIMCMGCITTMMALNRRDHGGDISREGACPFCRKVAPYADEEIVSKLRDRENDAHAQNILGMYYLTGEYGLPRDVGKSMELLEKSAKSGSRGSHYSLGSIYFEGDIAEKDLKKAKHHFELSAIAGHTEARFWLGVLEGQLELDDNYHNRAMRHWAIAARSGHVESMQKVRQGYTACPGMLITKDELVAIMRAHQESIDGMKSKDRTLAATVISMRK